MTGLSLSLHDAVASLARSARLLVALDFDGTLAPFVDDPADARALPASARAIDDLVAAEGTFVALVSGRSLASLRAVSSPDPRILLVGSHGAERYAPEGFDAVDARASLSPEAQGLLSRAGLEMADLAQNHQGAWVEEKPAGVVLHTRMVEPGSVPELMHQSRLRLETLGDGVKILRGKDVVEVSVLPADKGQGLDWLRATTEADTVLFAGDDRTDEDAMRRLTPSDVGVKVGSGPSAARYRVDGPGDLAALLDVLADVRD